MSLRYLTIKEGIYNLPKDELKTLIKESIFNLSLDEVRTLIDEIQRERFDIISKKQRNAAINFNEKINQVTKIGNENRDWHINYPKKDDRKLTVYWNQRYHEMVGERKICYAYRLVITENDMKNERYIICSCMSPYLCSSNCYERGASLKFVLASASVKDNELEINTFKNDILGDYGWTSEDWENWARKTISLYSPILFNFQEVYDSYDLAE